MNLLTPPKGSIRQNESPRRLDETTVKDSMIKGRRDLLNALSPDSKATFESLPIPAPFSNYLTVTFVSLIFD